MEDKAILNILFLITQFIFIYSLVMQNKKKSKAIKKSKQNKKQKHNSQKFSKNCNSFLT